MTNSSESPFLFLALGLDRTEFDLTRQCWITLFELETWSYLPRQAVGQDQRFVLGLLLLPVALGTRADSDIDGGATKNVAGALVGQTADI